MEHGRDMDEISHFWVISSVDNIVNLGISTHTCAQWLAEFSVMNDNILNEQYAFYVWLFVDVCSDQSDTVVLQAVS